MQQKEADVQSYIKLGFRQYRSKDINYTSEISPGHYDNRTTIVFGYDKYILDFILESIIKQHVIRGSAV